ncbi:DNA replication terminus site-binding protein [Pseudoalteromonas marina]|uniref:DNA replication terminus site-binding protein n=2 Tax=Bacteria TaxID=2 RepID=A0ABT9FCK4_9GAMM|nr:DNA replication terminus site-binding protein [Pseudoalteromonas marina]MDP2564365.1 DNA replication terminus site-binding protein [Pseudoalteromonas marina]
MEFQEFKSLCAEGMDEELLFKFVSSGMEHLKELNSRLKSNLTWEKASLYNIRDELLVSENEGAPVSVFDESETSKMLLYGISKYKRDLWQHPKRTFRLPGVVFSSSKVIGIVEQLNEVKSLIRFAVCNSALHERQRAKFFSQRIDSNIVLKELYRNAVVFNENVKSVSFTWAKNVPQTLIVSKKIVLDGLKAELLDATKARAGLINRDIDILSCLSDNGEFKRVRRIPPHPRCNIVSYGKNLNASKKLKPRRSLKHAHLPVFINTDYTSVSDCLVRPLSDIDLSVRKDFRPNKMEGFEKVIERLDLYYRPPA